MKNKMEDKRPGVKKGTIKRLLKIVTTSYKKRLVLVAICLIISSVVSVSMSLFSKTLIDNYIVPLLGTEDPVFDGLKKLILIMCGVFLLGIIATFIYNRLMVTIAQGTLKKIRDTMFTKMQKLPIEYFDTNPHGDVMSHYTNDTDTLEQMISQSLPQLASSIVSLIAITISMFVLSWQLTIFIFIFVIIMFKITASITKRSGSYFVGQQDSLGKVNGYIEEMINGQKVVKVFCHEEKAKEEFDKLNDDLCEQVHNANRFSNILGPVNGALGNVLYALIALFGRNICCFRNRRSKCRFNSFIFTIK